MYTFNFKTLNNGKTGFGSKTKQKLTVSERLRVIITVW